MDKCLKIRVENNLIVVKMINLKFFTLILILSFTNKNFNLDKFYNFFFILISIFPLIFFWWDVLHRHYLFTLLHILDTFSEVKRDYIFSLIFIEEKKKNHGWR